MRRISAIIETLMLLLSDQTSKEMAGKHCLSLFFNNQIIFRRATTVNTKIVFRQLQVGK